MDVDTEFLLRKVDRLEEENATLRAVLRMQVEIVENLIALKVDGAGWMDWVIRGRTGQSCAEGP